MKLPIVFCLATFVVCGTQGSTLARREGSTVQTSYVGKIHETNIHGKEECVGTFSGSNSYHQPAGTSWSDFAQKCKDLVGGIAQMLSSADSSCCGRRYVDLDLKTRIIKDCCPGEVERPTVVTVEPVTQIVQPQTHIVQPQYEVCDDCKDTPQIVMTRPVSKPSVLAVQPVYQPPPAIIEKVIHVMEKDDDCDDHKHHHHKHHKHHHHHHKHDHHKHDHHKHDHHKHHHHHKHDDCEEC